MSRQSFEAVEPLRLADWRYLLPDPLDRPFRHLVLVGGPDELPDLLERSGIAERVVREIPKERCADAAILLDSSLASLQRAAGCLAPGGSLYGEFDRRSRASFAYSPARVRRLLERAGLSPTGAYWIRPGLIRRQVYVPLHVAGPLGWYLRSLLTASSPAERILELALRTLERLGPRSFAAFAPCYGVTAVAGPITETTPSVVRHAALPAEARGSDPQILVITQGKEDFKRVTVLPFEPSGAHPLAALKLARLARYNEATRTEQDVQETIRSALDGAMRESVPKPLGFVSCGDVPIGIESVAPGRSIASKVNRWRVPLGRKIPELRRAAAWLTEFNCRVQIERSDWGEKQVSEWIEEPFAAYERAFGVTRAERRLFAATRSRARALIGVPLPTVWVHWDFSEYNVHSTDPTPSNPGPSDTGLTVLDWERATPGPPLMDMLFFGIIWSCSARCLNDDSARLGAFRQLFCEPDRVDPVSAEVHGVFDRYMAAVGVDERFLPLLLVVVCVKRALIHLGRRMDSPARVADSRPGNPYVDWLDVLTEDAGRLFSEA